ncbi:hypothetical protein Esi_0030_0011 [Ectocarpus siliculosus]|uniref:Uncharacterized protein n=1 Tax=Ectocarpus siliculosus TaxID=2880 RepID=D8LKE6_ECTSI|nr:hypothetical protein Esi_0030_0011 [Ectocarpus siliculosus]|eukprot:CBN74536.1 hypothetical protein Esi_0030_0011 [Ectocarpus siliculosus]
MASAARTKCNASTARRAMTRKTPLAAKMTP